MRRAAILMLMLAPATASAQVEAPIVAVEANARAIRLPMIGSGEGLDTDARDRSDGVGIVSLDVPADTPVLVLVDHAGATSLRVRAVDAPPWVEPHIAQSLALEPRRPLRRPDRLIEGAWIVAPPGPVLALFLVVEVGGAPAGAGDVAVEVYRPDGEAPRRSLARIWGGASGAADFPSPLQRAQRRQAQMIRRWDTDSFPSP